jgi:hypothetical protein
VYGLVDHPAHAEMPHRFEDVETTLDVMVCVGISSEARTPTIAAQ